MFSNATEFIDMINLSEYDGLEYSNWGSNILFRWRYPDGKPVDYIKQDTPLFIDYLAPIAEENGDSLLRIINNIESNLYQNTSIYSKFRWVADYLRSLSKREFLNDNIFCSEADYRLDNL